MKIDTDDFKGKVFKVEDCENRKVHLLSKYLLRPNMHENGVREVTYIYIKTMTSVFLFLISTSVQFRTYVSRLVYTLIV